MSRNILIGTSGYSYREWVGPFYPQGTQPKDYLSVYADTFDFTEINFTYYRQPEWRTMARMVEVTPPGFMFSVKIFSGVTHSREGDLKSEISRFLESLRPLIDSFRLAAVLVQFPFSFHYVRENRRYLDAVCACMEGIPAAVEFRNMEWYKESVFKGLEKRSISFVNVDMPELSGLPESTEIVTAPPAYLRMHGRNSQEWWTGDSATRYRYKYSDEQLSSWTGGIRSMQESAGRVVVAFNNHWEGYAAADALNMKTMLQ